MNRGKAHRSLDLSIFDLKNEKLFEKKLEENSIEINPLEMVDEANVGDGLMLVGHDLFKHPEKGQLLIPKNYSAIVTHISPSFSFVETPMPSEYG